MYRPTMSIRFMLAVVAFIALACVALVRANAIWASTLFTAALAAISFAVLAAIFRRGAKQAFWIGFALFGWLYLWMAHWPGEHGGGGTTWRLQSEGDGTLSTSRLLVYAYHNWLPKVRTPPAARPAFAGPVSGYEGAVLVPGGFGGGFGGAFGGPGTGGGGPTPPSGSATGILSVDVGAGPTSAGLASTAAATLPVVVPEYPAQHEFTRVGHSLFTIILAFLGGFLATYLYKTRDQAKIEKHTPPSNPPAIAPPQAASAAKE